MARQQEQKVVGCAKAFADVERCLASGEGGGGCGDAVAQKEGVRGT